MWTVEQIVDETVSIISCGTIEECLKAANRECIRFMKPVAVMVLC